MKAATNNRYQRALEYLVGVAVGGAIATVFLVCYSYFNPAGSAINSINGASDDLVYPVSMEGNEFIDKSSMSRTWNPALDEYERRFAHQAVLFSLLSKSSEEELIELLQQSTEIDQVEKREFIQEAIGRRYAEINPKKALQELRNLPSKQQHSLARGIFEQWSTSNLDDALAAAVELNSPLRSSAHETIVESRSDLHKDALLEISRQFGYGKLGLAIVHEQQAQALAEEPREAWESIRNDEIDDIYQLETIVRICEEWVDQEGFEALSHITSTGGWTIQHKVLEAITQADPSGTFNHLLNSTYPDKVFSLISVLTAWAELYPQDAFEAVSRLDDSSDSNSIRRFFISDWAKTNPAAILSQLTSYPKRMQLEIAEQAIGAIASSSPEDALQQLDQLEGIIDDTSSIASHLSYSWARNDPASTLDWVLSDAQASNPQLRTMTWEALKSLAPRDPQRAFEIALTLPLHRGGSGFDEDVIRWLCNSNMIDEALELLPKVREKSRPHAYNQVGGLLVESGQPERSLELAKSLTDGELANYYSYIGYVWSHDNLPQLLERLPSLSDDARSAIAARILRSNSWSPILTTEQAEFVSEFVNEEDTEE